MLEVLKKVYNKNDYVSIFDNYDDLNSFIFCKIIALNDEEILLYLISPYGDFDGLLFKQIKDIVRIEEDSKYNKKMQKIINNCPTCEYNFENSNLKNQILNYAFNNHKVISIELSNSGSLNISGYIDNIDDEICAILQLDEYGENDGKTYVRFDDITSISCSSKYEINLEKLLN